MFVESQQLATPLELPASFKLEGKLSYVVPFTLQHLHDPKYLNWLRDYEVIKTINRLEYIAAPVAFDEIKAYYQRLTNSKSDLFCALYAKSEDIFIGTVRVAQINGQTKTADLGILVGDKTQWGKGIATDALHTVGKYLFEKCSLRKLTSGVMAVNPSMIKVFQKLGFQQEGIFRQQDWFEGVYCDHFYFGCFRDEFRFDL